MVWDILFFLKRYVKMFFVKKKNECFRINERRIVGENLVELEAGSGRVS